jgi:hypothetical protein
LLAPLFQGLISRYRAGGEQIMREGNTQRQHAAVYRQRIDVSMDNGTRPLGLCEADRSDGVMGSIASLSNCVQVSSV